MPVNAMAQVTRSLESKRMWNLYLLLLGVECHMQYLQAIENKRHG